MRYIRIDRKSEGKRWRRRRMKLRRRKRTADVKKVRNGNEQDLRLLGKKERKLRMVVLR